MVQVGIWNLNYTVDDRIFLQFTPKYKAGFTQIRVICLFHSVYLVLYLVRISIATSFKIFCPLAYVISLYLYVNVSLSSLPLFSPVSIGLHVDALLRLASPRAKDDDDIKFNVTDIIKLPTRNVTTAGITVFYIYCFL